ncbi:hypothetical protein ISN44_As03g034620 [Arabidopsis suecica]|uniref:Uncharacterized protein n=1 Tax=Arabidopsis suecica TaxID=45249 RepID=A0A8T2FP74_ARASU|nr:hypothetical protein ISN44_As03g034620 [Arabidopsis suecica]
MQANIASQSSTDCDTNATIPTSPSPALSLVFHFSLFSQLSSPRYF